MGAGRLMRTESLLLRMGRVVSNCPIIACAAERAVVSRSLLEGFGGSGFGSKTARLPRSKVYGVGFEL